MNIPADGKASSYSDSFVETVLQRAISKTDAFATAIKIGTLPTLQGLIAAFPQNKQWRKDHLSQELLQAYIYYLAGISISDMRTRISLLTDAQGIYLRIIYDKLVKSDIGYFSMWQLAMVRESLGVPWSSVSETLLSAMKFDENQAESLYYLIQHYRQHKQYPIAFIYASFGMQKYHDRCPSKRTWYTDTQIYQWKLLNAFTSICSHLGFLEKARSSFAQLLDQAIKHPENFTEEQLNTITANRKIYNL